MHRIRAFRQLGTDRGWIAKGLVECLGDSADQGGIGPGDRCAQLTNISFDVILRDVLMPLWSGATLCLPPSDLPPLPLGFVGD